MGVTRLRLRRPLATRGFVPKGWAVWCLGPPPRRTKVGEGYCRGRGLRHAP